MNKPKMIQPHYPQNRKAAALIPNTSICQTPEPKFKGYFNSRFEFAAITGSYCLYINPVQNAIHAYCTADDNFFFK